MQSHPGLPASTCSMTDVRLSALPTETSVLVRVSHVALHPGSTILMNLVPASFRRFPAVPETDFSGVVVEIGSRVQTSNPSDPRNFPIGTPVFGSIDVSTHLGTGRGALAQYVAVETACLARKPDNVSFAEAAGLGVSMNTAAVLVDAAKNLPSNPRVLVNAACGGVGHFSTQLLRHKYPEAYIVGICSAKNINLAKELGCNEVIDYTSFPKAGNQTLTQHLKSRYGNGETNQFDAIFDAHGNQDLFGCSTGYLKPGSNHPYVSVGPKMANTWFAIPGFMWNVTKNVLVPAWLGGVPRTHKQISAFMNTEGIEKSRKLAAEGAIKTRIGGTWDMDQALDAYEKLMSGHASGKVLVKIWKPRTDEFSN